jgi:hypothetical protein
MAHDWTGTAKSFTSSVTALVHREGGWEGDPGWSPHSGLLSPSAYGASALGLVAAGISRCSQRPQLARVRGEGKGEREREPICIEREFVRDNLHCLAHAQVRADGKWNGPGAGQQNSARISSACVRAHRGRRRTGVNRWV